MNDDLGERRMSDKKVETTEEVIAAMRRYAEIVNVVPDPLGKAISDLLREYADRFERATARQNHCEKKFDEDGNEMPPHTETMADIVAMLRANARGERFDDFSFTSLADRIEAAYKRERNAHTNDIHDALYKATGIPGNAAEMREALENARSKFIHIKKCADEGEVSRKKLTILCEFVSQEIAAALAAPARNADRFKTMEAARSAFRKFCRENYNSAYAAAGLDGCDDCELCETKNMSGEDVCPFAWLFAPVKEGGDHA